MMQQAVMQIDKQEGAEINCNSKAFWAIGIGLFLDFVVGSNNFWGVYS